MFAGIRRTLTTVTVPGNRHPNSHQVTVAVTVRLPGYGGDGSAACCGSQGRP